MRIQDMFRIPDGEKVTDKAFSKVLASSICGILLCMACLAGTTWAWFTADMASTDNVIQIATVTVDATVTPDDAIAIEDGSYTLPEGDYAVQVRVDNNATDAARPVYVLVTVTQDGGDTLYYLTFANGTTETTVQLTVEGSSATLRFTALWSQPAALPLGDTATVIGADAATTTTTTTTTTTATESTTTETEPTETQPTEAEPSETQPTETEPTETQPTEAEPTETQPTETQPTETQPTEAEPTKTQLTKTQPTEAEPTETQPTNE